MAVAVVQLSNNSTLDMAVEVGRMKVDRFEDHLELDYIEHRHWFEKRGERKRKKSSLMSEQSITYIFWILKTYVAKLHGITHN